MRNCYAIILAETWLNSSILGNAFSIKGLATFRANRSCTLSCESCYFEDAIFFARADVVPGLQFSI